MEHPAGVESAFEDDGTMDVVPLESPTSERTICNTNLTDDDIQGDIRSINMNLAGVCCCVAFVTSATTAVVSFAPAILLDNDLNTASLATVVAMEVVATALLLPYLNNRLGNRIMVTTTLILVYFLPLSYFYPSWATTLPASILLGLGQGFLATLFMYGNSLTVRYCQTANRNMEMTGTVVCGIIISSLGLGLLIGNAVLFLMLDPTVPVNHSNATTAVFKCGTQSCPSDRYVTSAATSYDSWRYYAMVEVLATLAIAGVLSSLFLKDFSKKESRPFHFLTITKETWLLMKDHQNYLLVGMTLFIGLEEAFVLSDYAKVYTSCSAWIPKVWLTIMMIHGAAQMTSGGTQWIIVKFFGRTLTVCLSVIIFVGCFIALIYWHPNSSSGDVYIVVAGLWGIAHGILFSVIFSLLLLHPQKTVEQSLNLAFFWRCLGHVLSFVLSQFLCTTAKLYILLAMGLIGFLKYLSLEQKLKMDVSR